MSETVQRAAVVTMGRALCFVAAVIITSACMVPSGALNGSEATPAPSPASLSDATEKPLTPGRYVTDGAFEPRIVLTISDGWSKNDYNAGRVSLVMSACRKVAAGTSRRARWICTWLISTPVTA